MNSGKTTMNSCRLPKDTSLNAIISPIVHIHLKNVVFIDLLLQYTMKRSTIIFQRNEVWRVEYQLISRVQCSTSNLILQSILIVIYDEIIPMENDRYSLGKRRSSKDRMTDRRLNNR